MASNLIGTRHVATPGSRSYAVERKLDAVLARIGFI